MQTTNTISLFSGDKLAAQLREAGVEYIDGQRQLFTLPFRIRKHAPLTVLRVEILEKLEEYQGRCARHNRRVVNRNAVKCRKKTLTCNHTFKEGNTSRGFMKASVSQQVSTKSRSALIVPPELLLGLLLRGAFNRKSNAKTRVPVSE